MVTNKARILILGTADWNQPIATNQHYAAAELSREFHVTFVESIGLRRLELSFRDAKRILGRALRQTSRMAVRRIEPSRLSVISPHIVPVHNGLFSRFNRVALERYVSEWRDYDGPKVLWAYTPVTYGLEKFADASIYHCVDLLGEFPGISRELIEFHERRLARGKTKAIASSAVVSGHLENLGFGDVKLWPNVAEVGLISARRPIEPGSQESFAVFAGNLSPHKIDFQLVRDLLDAGVKVHVAGPVAQGGGSAAEELETLVDRGAVYHGLLSLDELADLYWRADVGIIPYLLNGYTQGVSPLKTFEYLAAGLAVVSSPIPSVLQKAGMVEVADSSAEFILLVETLIGTRTAASLAARQHLAQENSWKIRGAQMRSLVRERTKKR